MKNEELPCGAFALRSLILHSSFLILNFQSVMNKIVECVPNFSEGRDLQKIDRIVAPFRG